MTYIPSWKKINNFERNMIRYFELSKKVTEEVKHSNINLANVYISSPRAFLKYIPLMWWTDIYTTIQGGRRDKGHIDAIYYIDIFAGSGITRLKNAEGIYPGSPIVAYYFAKRKYDLMLLNEKDKGRASVLKKSMKIIEKLNKKKLSYHIYQYDAKRFVKGIDRFLKERYGDDTSKYHLFIFADFEGPSDLEWKYLGRLLRHDGDIIVNFQISGVLRNKDNKTFLNKVYGSDFNIKTGRDESYYLEQYIERLKSTGREMTSEILIRDKTFHYYLILSAKKTQRGSPWFKAWLQLKSWIESFDAEIADLEREIFFGKQKRLMD